MPNDTDGVADTYAPDQERTLFEAVIEAIAQCRDTDPATTEFMLYEYIDHDALQHLFSADASQHPLVQFTADDVQVTLWGDTEVNILVERLPAEPLSLQLDPNSHQPRNGP